MENNNIPEFDLELDEAVVIQLPEGDDLETPITDDDNSDKPLNNGLNDKEDEPVVEVNETAKVIFEQLVEEQVLPDDSEFDGSWESLRKNISELPQKILNSIIETRNDVSKDVLRYIFTSNNISKDEMLNFIETNMKEISEESVSIDTLDSAREYLETLYKERGLKPKVIEATLAVLEEDQTLLDEAKEEFEKKKLASKTNTEKLIAEKENEELKARQQRMEFTNSIIETLNSTGWKPNKVEAIKQRIANNEINPILAEIFKSPKALIKMVDFIGYYKNGDIEYDAFIAASETPKVKDFRSKLENSISSPTLSTRSNLKNPEQGDDNLKAII